MRKTLALILALCMLLSIGVSASAESLSVLANGNMQQFFAGEDENHNDIHTWLSEKSGFDLNYTVLPSEGGEEKRNLIMTSGEAPDMIVIGRSTFLDYVSQGLLQPLDEAIAASGKLEGTECMAPEVAQMGVVDGVTYAICTPNNGGKAPISFLYNIAALEEAGVKIPTEQLTPETLHEFLREVHEKCPDMITFASAGAKTSDYHLSGFQFLYCAYGLDTEFRLGADGKLEMSSTTEDMRECLSLIAQMYSEGLIDPEYSVTKTDKLQEKFLDNRVATMGLQWYDEAYPTTLMANEDGSWIWKWLGNVGGRDNSTQQDFGGTVSNYLCVPYNSTKAKEVVDYAALLCSPEAYDYMMLGEEGYDYERDAEGKITIRPESRRATVGTQYYVYYYVCETLAQRNERIWRNDEGQDWYQQWEHHCATELKGAVDPALSMPVIDEYVEYMTDLRALAAEYFMKIATGALPLEAFDEYLRKFDELGGNEVVAAVNEWYANR